MTILGKTKHRILAHLKNKPSHGYDLSKQLDLPITGIYQHLKELTRDGLVAAQEDGIRKKYCLTEKGVSLLDLIDDT